MALTDTTAAIPVEDLEIIRAALNSGFHHSTILDLAEQYRKLAQRPVASKLTQGLQNALTLVISYIDMAEATEAPNEA
jgi:hypothetical protein